ncbi:MAG: preprotein translocase subunit SecE [Phycisphaerales bacterium]|nr:preprotein translocase subunit SecE [Phycisphaerales bacterium]MCI0675808.1 preprotein translocase subunit SecE [Phycisphaerales bacterium]
MAAIYKPNQGYWTRLMSALGLALIVLMGVAWLWRLLATVRLFGQEPVIGQASAALLVTVVFGVLGYYLIARSPRFVDFLISVESEMKKVNWSTKREVIGSTWVVIGLTTFIGVLCWVFDMFFQIAFTWMGVLET